MQVTDKLLLPATISYTGQHSSPLGSADVTEHSDVSAGSVYSGSTEQHSSSLSSADVTGVEQSTAEADKVAAAFADGGDGAGSEQRKTGEVCSLTLDDPDGHVTASNCTEANELCSVRHDTGLSMTDSVSVMTVSLVNLTSDCVRDAVEDNLTLTSSSLLHPLAPSSIHIDSTLLQTAADAGIVITDTPSAGSDAHYTSEPCLTSNHEVPNHGDGSLVQQPAEWTRYLTLMSCLCNVLLM